ncbi:dihydrodipicolinate synthase family protein [Parabacteroides sp. BX2]|mgnify:CR=1 FL=1|jgi:4-hydroxy-tetrahydrodipicolinate synthase|uniref:Dihydrodipicolinate synthase family protein n=1 Tax=Parabacteroides segnis TaxID=2763058 RepID=A0ABR7E4R4_9BACT|nr:MULTISPECIES: dihydrodipicolinate synthase family protein [Parabacteroides]MBC5644746.1 dihydrodipicolinate synthase family protein [Parabacteroides segnis]MCM0714553.1 dihydrodipicolinate synthase family protein [Parabacteroides sp. TA-V-105]
MFTKPLRGIIPPVITPMIDNDTLDVIGLENLLNRMIKGGVSGVFILGTSGEAQNISYNVRKELIKETCRIVEKRIPVLVGITDTSFSESLLLAANAALYGADALVAAPPYYFAPGQAELIQYYNDLANQLPLPLFLYNMPSHVKVMIEPETVLALSENPNIIGLKDSSANGVYFQKLIYLLRNKPEFTLLCGPEEMTAEVILMGGHGGVNGGANLFPELYVALYDAAASKDFEKLAELQSQVLRVSLSLYNIGKYASSYIKGVKTALNLLGVCSDYMAEPFHKFKDAERAVVKKKLIELGLDI